MQTDAFEPNVLPIFSRGVPLSYLLRFYNYTLSSSCSLGPDPSTSEVVEEVIKRDTLAHKCSYVQLTGVPTGKPSFFISHTWSQPFRYIVKCLQQRLDGSDSESIVWLDIFALNQHQAGSVAAEKQLMCDLEDLQNLVSQTDRLLVVMDPAGMIFNRAW